MLKAELFWYSCNSKNILLDTNLNSFAFPFPYNFAWKSWGDINGNVVLVNKRHFNCNI